MGRLKTMAKLFPTIKFIWKVTYAHTIAYAVAVMLMMVFMNYNK